MSIHVRVAGRTDKGRVRTKNEDAFVISDLSGVLRAGERTADRLEVGPQGVLLAVSDGMGGEQAGHLASALVLHTLERAMASMPAVVPSALRVGEAIQRAHESVLHVARTENMRMGATLTAVFVHGAQAFVAEVGDSRAYLIRSGRLVRLTHDQSMVQSLLDKGVVTPEEADRSPFRNVILQAMGHQEHVQVELGRLELRQRDCLILCSDGLTRHVPDEELRTIVLGATSLEGATERLITLANARGGEDNITVVTAGIAGDLQLPVEPIERTHQLLSTFADGS